MTKQQHEQDRPEQRQREKEPARSGSIAGPTYENTNADERGDYDQPQGTRTAEFREERGSTDIDR